MAPAEMTLDEVRELRSYASGAKWSGAARRMYAEFMLARDWNTQRAWDAAIEHANERWANRSKHAKMLDSNPYCEICGERAAGVTWYGHHRCNTHWEYPSESGGSADGRTPLYDSVTGFPLNQPRT